MNLWQDIRFAARLLVKDRWFTLAAAFALALGIGANATVFTLVNAVLIRGLPFDEADRIVSLGSENARGQQMGVSFQDFEDWRDRSRSFQHLNAALNATVNVSDDEQLPERRQGTYTSWTLFRLIGQQPVLGRDFREDDDRTDAAPVVIIGHGLWQTRYGGSPDVLGRPVRVNSKLATIVGVMPPDMQFPANTEVWIPLMMLPPESFPGRGSRGFGVMGRLAPGVSLAQSRQELDALALRLAEEYPDTNKDIRPLVRPYDEAVNGSQIRLVFLSLMGAVGFVLLIACANVANLLLARSVNRAREIAVRVSLGASRWRIVRQLLVESVMLACLGGAAGFGIAVFGVRWFDRATVGVGKPYWMTFTFDAIVFAFVAAVCLLTGIVFGFAPALHVSKTDVNSVLKEGGRSGAPGTRARRWTGALIVGEVALTLVLLSGAGFMMRSFLRLYRLDAGIDTANLMTMQLYLPLTKYPQPGPRSELYQQLEDRLAAVPALRESTIATTAPLLGGMGFGLALDGRLPPEGEQTPGVSVVAAGDRYFDVLGISALRGRIFSRDDGLPGRGAVVVNQRFVDVHSSGEEPLGRQVRLMDSSYTEWATIVGIVPNIRQRNPGQEEPDPVVYVPIRALPERGTVLLVRARSNAAAITQQIRDELRIVEPDLPPFNIRTLDEALATSRWMYVTFGSMFAAFAAMALLLSAVGLYAVTAHSVTERTQEIGVRMALGAQSTEIQWLVLRRALIQLAIGLPLGIAGAVGVGQLLQSVLVATQPWDPPTLGFITVALLAVAITACLWPARRAARLNPVVALRYD